MIFLVALAVFLVSTVLTFVVSGIALLFDRIELLPALYTLFVFLVVSGLTMLIALPFSLYAS